MGIGTCQRDLWSWDALTKAPWSVPSFHRLLSPISPPFCTALPLSRSCSLPFSLMWASLNVSYQPYPPFFSTSNDPLSPFHSRMFCRGLLQLGVCWCCAFHSLPSQFSTTCCPLLVDTRVQYYGKQD